MPNLATMMEVDVKKHADIVKPAKIIAQQSLSSNLQIATETVDLRVKYGTPVRSQGGYCGNCYAYATIDAIEMFYRRMGINSGVSLSIQQLTDCSKNLLGRGLNYGCKGGWFLESYIYVSYYGLTNAQSYPISYSSYYQGLEQPCRSTYGPYKIAKPTYFSNNEKLSPYAASCSSRFPYLRQGLAISVAMQAADQGFYNYRGGVI